MQQKSINTQFAQLSQQLEGELKWDISTKLQYATDASAYREIPDAVAYPKSKADLQVLVKFAKEHGMALIPRTAGTSLAGQVVGKGIIVDLSKHWNRVLEINADEHWVRVEP
ncbi:MAG TPA: FAD-binding oxidoreductase, partial [Tenuifilaceae bacterium]|nr:FAD-binding oxidoreductase [Tenuifilaceae bacterium]